MKNGQSFGRRAWASPHEACNDALKEKPPGSGRSVAGGPGLDTWERKMFTHLLVDEFQDINPCSTA